MSVELYDQRFEEEKDELRAAVRRTLREAGHTARLAVAVVLELWRRELLASRRETW